MIIGKPSRQGETSIVAPATKHVIKDFLLGAVWAWCTPPQGSKDWFSAHDFLGKENEDLEGTPCLDLYNAYVAAGKTPDEAHRQAGIDIGHLLFNTLLEVPKRTFDKRKGQLFDGHEITEYTWV